MSAGKGRGSLFSLPHLIIHDFHLFVEYKL